MRDCDLIETTLHQLYAKWNVPKEIAGGEEWFEILDKNGKGWENCLLFLFSRAYDVEIYDKEHCEIISDVLSRDKSKKSSYFKLRRDTTKHEVFKKLNEFMKENCVYCGLFYTKQWQLFDSLEKQERNKDKNKDNKKQIEKIKEKEKQKEKLKKNEQQKNIETQEEIQDATHS